MKSIVKSLLDSDFYKFSMANLIYQKGYADVRVKYAFTNRTKSIDLGDYIDPLELQSEFNSTRKINFKYEELQYLSGFFNNDFINAINNVKLPDIDIITDGGKFRGLEVEGSWLDTILWEIYILSTINEKFNKSFISNNLDIDLLFNEDLLFKGIENLKNTVEILKSEPGINVIEFGSRRRFSNSWQEFVIAYLQKELGAQLIGTSNVHFAQKFKLKSSGTQAHEIFMVYASIFNNDIEKAQHELLKDWYDCYGYDSSIALIDTWGTDFFLKNFTKEQALRYKGLRQDSGDPIEIGEKIIQYYKNIGVDPLNKIIVFSDGLDAEKVLKIYKHFKNKIGISFGIGTSLSNNVGFPNLSIVVKAVEANGQGLVKLSDNISKAVGRPEDIEKYKSLVGYSSTFDEKPTY